MQNDLKLTASGVPEDIARDVKVLPDDQGLDSTKLKRLESVLDTKAVLAGVLTNFVEVLLDELLLLDELDVGKRLRGKLNSLS